MRIQRILISCLSLVCIAVSAAPGDQGAPSPPDSDARAKLEAALAANEAAYGSIKTVASQHVIVNSCSFGNPRTFTNHVRLWYAADGRRRLETDYVQPVEGMSGKYSDLPAKLIVVETPDLLVSYESELMAMAQSVEMPNGLGSARLGTIFPADYFREPPGLHAYRLMGDSYRTRIESVLKQPDSVVSVHQKPDGVLAFEITLPSDKKGWPSRRFSIDPAKDYAVIDFASHSNGSLSSEVLNTLARVDDHWVAVRSTVFALNDRISVEVSQSSINKGFDNDLLSLKSLNMPLGMRSSYLDSEGRSVPHFFDGEKLVDQEEAKKRGLDRLYFKWLKNVHGNRKVLNDATGVPPVPSTRPVQSNAPPPGAFHTAVVVGVITGLSVFSLLVLLTRNGNRSGRRTVQG